MNVNAPVTIALSFRLQATPVVSVVFILHVCKIINAKLLISLICQVRVSLSQRVLGNNNLSDLHSN